MPKGKSHGCLMGILVLSGCLLSGCASSSLSSDRYHPERYLTGRGCGKSLAAAKASALSSISEKMRVSVRSHTRIRQEDTAVEEKGRNSSTMNSKTMEAIDLKSRETFFSVRFPQKVMTPEGPCVLAVMDKTAAKRKLRLEISRMRTRLADALNLSVGSSLELLHVFIRSRNALFILKSDSETLSDLGSSPGTFRFMNRMRVKIGHVRKQLTFAMNAHGGKDLLSFVPVDMESVGLQEVPMKEHPAFVVQGSVRMAPVRAPDNSPWFWYGFSGALAIVDTKTMLNVAISSGSGTVPGYTATQAEVRTQRTIEQTIVFPLIKKLLGV